MATKSEYAKRYGWWLNELDSLGVTAKKTNELNDINEISKLTQNLKQHLYREYKHGLPYNLA
jgi:hypothetical protein